MTPIKKRLTRQRKDIREQLILLYEERDEIDAEHREINAAIIQRSKNPTP